MTYSEFLEGLPDKLVKIREANNMTVTTMASELKVKRGSYYRNEKDKHLPGVFTLFQLGARFNVSLNWLILGVGPMFLPGKTEEKSAEAIALESKVALLNGEAVELLEYMDKIPLFRHEILAQLERFKEERRDVVDKAFPSSPKKKK